MTDELVALTVMDILTLLFGRLTLEKKGIKTQKWILYPVAFSVVILTTYIVYDTFF
tara:strand:+ start:858 stop:1025 length:168 start_codon:yes stop_codon:yes gene_type:complete